MAPNLPEKSPKLRRLNHIWIKSYLRRSRCLICPPAIDQSCLRAPSLLLGSPADISTEQPGVSKRSWKDTSRKPSESELMGPNNQSGLSSISAGIFRSICWLSWRVKTRTWKKFGSINMSIKPRLPLWNSIERWRGISATPLSSGMLIKNSNLISH